MMRRGIALAVVLLVLAWPRGTNAYGVLSHEAIVDAVWASSIVPILRARYHPSEHALQDARAFAYGGCLIQDVGYYPFSSRFYGDLTHYVRSGDFIEALIREAHSANELAFAVGALAHYAADNMGHPIAINPSVSLMYPKLGVKYGTHATYEDNPTAHVRTEFGFDVVQLAAGAYLPQAYHDFIGFEIAKPLLERAFRDTYGLELKDVFANFDLSLGSFRWAVGSAIPRMTKIAWDLKRHEIEQVMPGVGRDQFLFAMPRATFEAEWGRTYRRPGIFQRVLGLIVRVIPKIGPFRALSFKTPTPEAERLFLDSMRATVTRYRTLLASVAQQNLRLENRNFDTGEPVKAGAYRLADEAYADLLARLNKDDFSRVTPALRANLRTFFAQAGPEPRDRHEAKAWRDVQTHLRALNAAHLERD